MPSRRTKTAFFLALAVAPGAVARPEPAWDAPPPRAVPAHIPPAARGFQAAARSGVSLPWGDASAESGDELAARNGLLVPLIIDAGFKLSKPAFLGIFAGIAYGTPGNDPRVAELCDSEGYDCSVIAYQFGVQGQYQFGASERINPWVGYGFGYEIVRQSLSSEGYEETQSSSGVTYLKVGLGVDFRGPLGAGPFVEISAGRFDAASTDVGGTEVHQGPVDEGAWHGYLTVGLRVVVFP